MTNLYLNSDWKRIGISISGGADSALLAYLICSNTDADIHFTNQIRCWKKRPWQEHIADTVIDWFKNRFNNKFYVHKNLIPPELEHGWNNNGYNLLDEYGKQKSGNQIILRSFNEYVGYKYKLQAWYAAINKNPHIDIPGSLKDRDQGHVPPIMQHMGVTVCHPFVYTAKDWIVKQYHKENILDLFNLTRSCEGEFEGLDYTTYTPGQIVPTCGECFWCKEREWGIDQAIK